MVGLGDWAWGLGLGLPVLALHLVSVTFTRALRTYSRTRLVQLCTRLGHPDRAEDVAHQDERTERAAETLAVVTGLTLAALLGVSIKGVPRGLALAAVLPIALGVSALGYVLAGVVGRVFAEAVIDALWPTALALRLATGPLTYGFRRLETLVEWLAGSREGSPRPASVEVEIPAETLEPGEDETDLPEATRALLQQVVAMTHRDVSELMTPRSRMVTFPSTVTARAAARVFHDTGKSRVPVYGENHDDVVGILYAKDLFARMTDVSDPDAVVPHKLVRPAYCVPETKSAYDLLAELRAQRTQIAIVLDEYGGVSGLITFEDLLEELVGEIDDEHDLPTPRDPVVPLGGARYEVDAALALEDLNDRLGLRLPTDGDFVTVGGLAFHALGRMPEAGATFRHDGIEFRVLEVANHAIKRVQLDLQPLAAVNGQ